MKRSKIIKAMTLLLGMFSFVLSDCGGADTSSTSSSSSYDNTSQISQSSEGESSIIDDTSSPSEEDSSYEDSSVADSSSEDSSIEDSSVEDSSSENSSIEDSGSDDSSIDDSSIDDSSVEDSSSENSSSEESSVEEESSTPEHAHVYDTDNIEWSWVGYESATATFTCIDGDDTQVVDATITNEVTTDPACETEGLRTYTATVTFEGRTYSDKKTQSIDATGHTYDTDNIEWTWVGYESATATFTCIDGDDTQVIDATITNEVTADPACETEGVRTYTATVTFEGGTYSDQKTQSIDATGHVWDTENIEWTWSDDYSMAVATFTCLNDLNHTQKKTASVTSTVITESTCAASGETTYIATVEFENNTYSDTKTEYTPHEGHDIDETTHTCSKCGYKDGLSFTLNDDGVSYSVTGEGNYITYHGNSVEIPSYYNGLPVTAIGRYAFYVCTTITSVSVPSTVKTVGEYAFYGCRSLATINLSEGVESIGAHAFDTCRALTGITLPSTLTSLGYSVFYNCSALAQIVSENGFVYFDSENKFIYVKNSDVSYSFNESIDRDITSATIPDTVNELPVTGIGDYAFEEFRSLTDITLPEGLTSIGEYAFGHCTTLTGIDLPEGLTYIGEYAFGNCWCLASIVIPKGVTSLGYSAFYQCYDLVSITFASDSELKSIGDYAFYYCWSLESIVLPEGVESIGEYAFYYCTALTGIILPEGLASIGEYAFYYCTSLATITLPSTLTSLGSMVFYGCSTLTEIVSENGFVYYDSENKIVYVKNSDTSYCLYEALDITIESITVPTAVNSLSVTGIGDYAFYKCSSLTAIDIPEGITSIGEGAFSRCSALEKVTLPSTLAVIGSLVFYGCTSLTELVCTNGLLVWDSESKIIYAKNSDVSYSLYLCLDTSVTKVTIQETVNSLPVTEISPSAFEDCTNLTDVNIPEGVASIGEGAFAYCDSLADISLPGGLTRIESYAFYNCYSLTDINIPEGVSFIGEWAFYYCTSFTDIDIPEGVSFIGEGAFCYCTSLVSVILPSSVETIGEYAFDDCPSLAYICYEGSEYTLSYTFYYGTVYCYSEEEPAAEGNYWHYADGVPTVWETTVTTE